MSKKHRMSTNARCAKAGCKVTGLPTNIRWHYFYNPTHRPIKKIKGIKKAKGTAPILNALPTKALEGQPRTHLASWSTPRLRFCTQCGVKRGPSDRFCGGCGTKLVQS